MQAEDAVDLVVEVVVVEEVEIGGRGNVEGRAEGKVEGWRKSLESLVWGTELEVTNK